MKNALILLALCCFWQPLWAQQTSLQQEQLQADAEAAVDDGPKEVRYISDDLYTFIHSGPGRNYRIVGSINAGSTVTLVSIDQEAGYTEIIDDRQRQGWVDTRFVGSQESMRNRIPVMEQQLAFSAEQLAQSQQQIEQLQAQISGLNQEKASLDKQLENLRAEQQTTQQKLSNQKHEEQLDWLIRGGLLAAGCVFLGVMLTFIPKPKKRNDTWM